MSDKPIIAIPGLVIDNPTQYFIDATCGRKAMIMNHHSNTSKRIAEIKAEAHTLKED